MTNINHNLPLIKDDSTNIFFHINKGVIILSLFYNNYCYIPLNITT